MASEAEPFAPVSTAEPGSVVRTFHSPPGKSIGVGSVSYPSFGGVRPIQRRTKPSFSNVPFRLARRRRGMPSLRIFSVEGGLGGQTQPPGRFFGVSARREKDSFDMGTDRPPGSLPFLPPGEAPASSEGRPRSIRTPLSFRSPVTSAYSRAFLSSRTFRRQGRNRRAS